MYDEHARASTEKRNKKIDFFVVINKATGNQIRARVADNVSHWGPDRVKFGVNSHWHQPACLQNYQKITVACRKNMNSVALFGAM
jgi:DNA-binding FadR family transcriptional regulator